MWILGESVEGVRIGHLEANVSKLQANDEKKTDSIVAIEKSNIKMDGNIEKILDKLTNLETTTKVTEKLATNLKVVTDKQTTDLTEVKGNLTEVKGKVTTIEELPAKNAKLTRALLKGAIITNGVVFVFWLIRQMITWFPKE